MSGLLNMSPILVGLVGNVDYFAHVCIVTDYPALLSLASLAYLKIILGECVHLAVCIVMGSLTYVDEVVNIN
jgi:hypothetical protein